MNPAILARLFQASQATQHQQQPPQGPPLQQEPGPIKWGTGLGPQGQPPQGHPAPIDLSGPLNNVPGGHAQSSGDMTLPPSDYKYLDRVEGDDRPLGVMFGQSAGQPEGMPQNVPMAQLPRGAREGQYISPMDIRGRR